MEKLNNSFNRSTARTNESVRIRDNERSLKSKNSLSSIIELYEQGIKESPKYICVCCGGLFFKRGIREFDPRNSAYNVQPKQPVKNSSDHNARTLLDYIYHYKLRGPSGKIDGKNWICLTCLIHVKKKLVPPLALSTGLEFPNVHKSIADLNDLEAQMCSPRIPFVRIKELSRYNQKGLKGNVVNVPINPATTVSNILKIAAVICPPL